jgi:hypothetical protein
MRNGKEQLKWFPKIFDKKDPTDSISTFQGGEVSCGGEINDQVIWKNRQSRRNRQFGLSYVCSIVIFKKDNFPPDTTSYYLLNYVVKYSNSYSSPFN